MWWGVYSYDSKSQAKEEPWHSAILEVKEPPHFIDDCRYRHCMLRTWRKEIINDYGIRNGWQNTETCMGPYESTKQKVSWENDIHITLFQNLS